MLGWLLLDNSNSLIFYGKLMNTFPFGEESSCTVPTSTHGHLGAAAALCCLLQGSSKEGGGAHLSKLGCISFSSPTSLFLWQRVKPLRGPGLLTIHHFIHFLWYSSDSCVMQYKCPLIHMVCYSVSTHTHTHICGSGKHVWAHVGGVSWWLTAQTLRTRKKKGLSWIPYSLSKMFPSFITGDLSSLQSHCRLL